MKKLPNIYKNSIDKVIRNNESVCYCNRNNVVIENNSNVSETINSILKDNSPNYMIDVNIVTNDGSFNTSIINRYNNRVLTLDNKIIDIDDIISIERKKS